MCDYVGMKTLEKWWTLDELVECSLKILKMAKFNLCLLVFRLGKSVSETLLVVS